MRSKPKTTVTLSLLLPVLVEPLVSFAGQALSLSEAYDVVNALASDYYIHTPNVTHKYYCVFRSNWDRIHHPADYPELSRWSDPILFSHTRQYVPGIENRRASVAIEQLAEHGFNDRMRSELTQSGKLVGNWIEARGFFINQDSWDQNYVYLPPLAIDADHPYLTAMAGMKPSPDWFTQFYLFSAFDQETMSLWDRFKILTYPWDAGTDDGEQHEALNSDTDPPGVVHRIRKEDRVGEEIFLNADGTRIEHLAEWECVLHTCPEDTPDCVKDNWPPECDVLKYPLCATQCDPEAEECEECRRRSKFEDIVFRHDCCLAGRLPKGKKSCMGAPNSAVPSMQPSFDPTNGTSTGDSPSPSPVSPPTVTNTTNDSPSTSPTPILWPSNNSTEIPSMSSGTTELPSYRPSRSFAQTTFGPTARPPSLTPTYATSSPISHTQPLVQSLSPTNGTLAPVDIAASLIPSASPTSTPLTPSLDPGVSPSSPFPSTYPSRSPISRHPSSTPSVPPSLLATLTSSVVESQHHLLLAASTLVTLFFF